MSKLNISAFFLLLNLGFVLSQNLVPTDKLALIKGSVKSFKGKVLPKETIMFISDQTKNVVTVISDENGTFEALIPVNCTYGIKYKNFTTDMEYNKLNIPKDKLATYELEIRIDPPVNFVLDNVYFDTGKSTLKPTSYKALNDLAEILKIKNTMVVEIQGHTDNVGKEEENTRLSQKRAEEVKKYLVAKGIEAKRIQAKGYGPTLPIADNATDEGRAKNRRTSLNVIKE